MQEIVNKLRFLRQGGNIRAAQAAILRGVGAYRAPEISLETIQRTVLVTDARNSSKAYFSEKADEALVRIERDRALFAQIAAAHGGEEVRDRGDGSMFTFCDPAEAVKAAMAMQSEIARLNVDLPPESLRLVHRMGVHVGEIKLVTTQVSVGGVESVRRKMSGDIVVTAARLEAICHPGEVCFSSEVYRVARRSIEHEFRFLDSTLKGFDRPVRVWSSRLDPTWARPLTAEEEKAKENRKEEARLRRKWEAEQKERGRRHRALRFAIPLVAVAMSWAGGSYAMSAHPELAERIHRAVNALVGTVGIAPVMTTTSTTKTEEMPEKMVRDPSSEAEPVAVSPSKRSARRTVPVDPPEAKEDGQPSSRAVAKAVSAAIREDVKAGNFTKVGEDLKNLPLQPKDYADLVKSAQSLVEVQEWLVKRLPGGEGGMTIPCGPGKPIRSIETLTKVDDDGLHGLNGEGVEVTIYYHEMRATEFFNLISTATPATPTETETVPESSPQHYAECLSTLRKAARL